MRVVAYYVMVEPLFKTVQLMYISIHTYTLYYVLNKTDNFEKMCGYCVCSCVSYIYVCCCLPINTDMI